MNLGQEEIWIGGNVGTHQQTNHFFGWFRSWLNRFSFKKFCYLITFFVRGKNSFNTFEQYPNFVQISIMNI